MGGGPDGGQGVRRGGAEEVLEGEKEEESRNKSDSHHPLVLIQYVQFI